MLTKSTIRSAGVAIGTFLLATGAMVSYGESQSEWLLKQLQITDGHVPEPSASAPGKVATPSRYEGASLTVRAATADQATKGAQVGKSATQGGAQFRGDDRLFPSDGM